MLALLRKFPTLTGLLDDTGAHTKKKILGIYGFLAVLNAGAWIWAVVEFRNFPVLLGSAFLAYSLGLRHGVDADHIAAIDNVTRKLMQEGKRPVTVGLMFSMGHSTIVFLGAAALAAAASTMTDRFESLQHLGHITGTLVSTLFLFGIGFVNLMVLRSVYRAFQRVRRGEYDPNEDGDIALGGGLLCRLLGPMFTIIRRSWHMYPLGVLFGLGFDTATEIGLLGMSAAQASNGLSLWSVLVFPTLFAAGMSLVDATDNILMLGAYGWAFVKPVRKLYYNMTITFVSVVVAVLVGGVEALGLVASHYRLEGAFWTFIANLNGQFGLLGYSIIGVFMLSWIVSIGIYKWQNFDDVEPNL